MASLHRPNDPKPILSKPLQTFAKYLGKSGGGEAEFEIMGEVYTGTVVTYSPSGTPGAPSIGTIYPASSARPHLSNTWAVRIDPGNNRITPREPGPSTPGYWERHGGRLEGEWWLGNPDLPPNIETLSTVSETFIPGAPSVSVGGLLVWADDNIVKTTAIDNPDGTPGEVEHSGAILSLWSNGADAWCITEAFINSGYDDGYADGYEAAFMDESGDSAYGQGYAAWELANDPDDYDPTGSNPGPPSVEGDEDYITGFGEGWDLGWENGYYLGWTTAGGPG
jgi:hypothetical protein